MKNLNQPDADKIDQLLWDLYRPLYGKELSRVYQLFKGDTFLRGLTEILKKSIPESSRSRHEIEVKIGWIDKRPYALMSGATNRVELSDAVFFHIEKNRSHHITASKCLLLQAKITDHKDQLTQPKVPVNPSKPSKDSSTFRELRLLSQWPEFQLFDHSRSKRPRATSIDISSSDRHPVGNYPHGWFMATPERVPTDSPAAWPSPWMCAPAIDQQDCLESLGSLLIKFFNSTFPGRFASVNGGRDFTLDARDLAPNRTPTCQNWDRLCVEILRAIKGEEIPRSLTGGRPVPKLSSGKLMFWFGYSEDSFDKLSKAIFHCWSVLMAILGRRRRLPVLVVITTKDEINL